jgi:hypothetical protein
LEFYQRVKFSQVRNRKQETGKRNKAQGSKLKAERKEKIGIGKEAGRMASGETKKHLHSFTG